MKPQILLLIPAVLCLPFAAAAVDSDFPKPYSPPCTERENVFEFTEKPSVRSVGEDRYEIAFAVKGACDATVGLINETGVVVRHLASGVLGANAPAPFQKNSLKQTLLWNGKDDLDEYVKEPGNLRVRVSLGLKPEFDKRLGVTNPKLIPGGPWGICIDEDGVYLFYDVCVGYSAVDVRVRKFDHDGHYVRTLLPPPANLPEEKLQGLGYVEYEPGRKALQSPNLATTWGGEPGGGLPYATALPSSCQPAIAGGRIYYRSLPAPEERGPALLHFVRTDGSLEAQGVMGRPFQKANLRQVLLAASPDGKWLYLTGDGTAARGGQKDGTPAKMLFRYSLERDNPGEVMVGEIGMVGSDNGHFMKPKGLDCDAQGRIYVSDHDNNRIQVFTPDGKHAKTIQIERPGQVNVHRKTGAIYVMHTARVQGASVSRISKLASFGDPGVEYFLDGEAGLMSLDSWAVKPRIWLYTGNVRIMEDDGRQLRKMADFGEDVRAEMEKAGLKGPTGWSGINRGTRLACDPVEENVYYGAGQGSSVFHLRTGRFVGGIRFPGFVDDIAFDKRGYMHCHFNPSDEPGVMRLNLGQGLRECPYDYGVEGKNGRRGILPCRDQLGAKFFQDGIGVNMRGDVAESCNIYYAPKRDDDAKGFTMAGPAAREAAGSSTDDDGNNYKSFMAEMQRRAKTGEAIYWVRPRPGVPLLGGTIWTFNRTGQVRDESAVTAGQLINGVAVDEDGAVYFVNNRTRLVGGKPFLAGHGGFFGLGRDTRVTDPHTCVQGVRQPEPFTGTLIKSGRKSTILSTAAPIALEERPARPAELTAYREEAWCEGAQWMYAGASGIVQGGCSCPTMRCHTDWYKRTFVPEKYRYSIGAVDTAGNLILHVGQYGNFDSGYGPQSKVPVGGDGIAMSDCRVISGTDNYLAFCDRGERIIVLKLNYHSEESVVVQ